MQALKVQTQNFTEEKSPAFVRGKENSKQDSSFKTMLKSMEAQKVSSSKNKIQEEKIEKPFHKSEEKTESVKENLENNSTEKNVQSKEVIKKDKKNDFESFEDKNEKSLELESFDFLSKEEFSDEDIKDYSYTISYINASEFKNTNVNLSLEQDFSSNVLPQVNVSETPVLTEDQLTYLKSSEEDSLEFLIDNAEEYTKDFGEKEKLNGAQNLSVEDPKNFLELAGLENKEKESISEPKAKDEKKEKNYFTFSNSKSLEVEEKGVFTVYDERTKVESVEKKDFLVVSKENLTDNTLSLELNLSETAEKNILSSNSQTASADGSVFKEVLAQQIQYNAPDFVKAGNIVLRDNNQGVINMNLKPESLGNVKINLQISDKNITGQITVASKEAYEAFRQNLEVLKNAFTESGFDTASFNLNLSSNADGGFMQKNGSGQEQNASNFIRANQTFGNYVAEEDSFDSSLPGVYRNSGDYKVDLIA